MTLLRQAVPAPPIGELYRRHLSTGRAAFGELLGGDPEVASAGAWVTTASGRRYLDCGGYGVFLLGHRPPRVVEAVRRQLDTHPLATRVLLEPVAARAAHALAAVAPTGLPYVHFVNSGAEATEAAIKLARVHGHDRLVSAVAGFHGKTTGALSLTANPVYQDAFRPLLPGVEHVRFGDADHLRAVLGDAGRRACVIVEPVQGEGGVVVPPPGYLAEVALACADHGAFLIVDEIQTGLGRLGDWWGLSGTGVRPDVMLVGKVLSGGVVPVAAMLATAAAYEPFSRDPYLHTSTFAGSPLACAAAEATLAVLREENVIERGAVLGERLLRRIRAVLARRCPGFVADVRGRGLLIGVEFHDPGSVGELALGLLDRGVIVNHSLNAARVLRLTPPAILTDAEADILVAAFDEAAHALAIQS
jgi:putrescine aminotransferase